MGSRTRSPAHDQPPPEIGPGTLYWRKIPDQAFTLFARKGRTLKLLAVFAYLRRNNLRELAVENGELMRLSDQSEGSVDRALADLEAAGWIERRRQHGRRVVVFLYDLATGPTPENGQCLHSSDALNAFRASDECIPRQRCMHSSDLRTPYKEGKTSVQTEEKDVPSPLPPPTPEPTAPMAAKTDGTGWVFQSRIEEPTPPPEVPAHWHRHRLFSRLLEIGRRNDEEAKAHPAPAPVVTPVQVPTAPVPTAPVQSAAVQLATPDAPIVEGRAPNLKVRPNDRGFPKWRFLAMARALDTAPDRAQACHDLAAFAAGRYGEPDNELTITILTYRFGLMTGEWIAGEILGFESSKTNEPAKAFAKRIKQAVASIEARVGGPPRVSRGANAPGAGYPTKSAPTPGVQRSSAS